MAGKDSKRFSDIIGGLSSRNREEKVNAVLALGILKVGEHADLLVDLLSSTDEEVVEATLAALGEIGNPKSIKYLVDFALSENPVLAEKAAGALSRMDLGSVMDLLLKAAVSDRPPALRRRLLSLMCGIHDPRVSAAMAEILAQSQDPLLLTEGLSYFIRFPSSERLESLKALSSHRQWEITLMAQVALSRLGDDQASTQLKRLAKSPAHPIRQVLVQSLNRHPTIQDRDLYEGFFRDQHPGLRLAAMSGLNLFNAEERVKIILEWEAREKDENVRHELLRKAVFERNPVFFKVFVNLLGGSSEQLLQLGREGISSMGKPVLDTILKHFTSLPLTAREQILLAVGNIGGEKSIALAESCLSARERWLKINAIEALSSLGAKKFAPRFLGMLKGETDIWVRATLLSGLSRLGSDECISALVENLGHSDPRVRANAVEGLSRFGKADLKSLIEPFLNDGTDRVRVNAAIALWKTGHTHVVEILIERSRDPNKWVRSSAVFALGEIGEKTATPALIERLRDPDEIVYRNTLEALSKIGDIRSLIPILREKKNTKLGPEVYRNLLEQYTSKLRSS